MNEYFKFLWIFIAITSAQRMPQVGSNDRTHISFVFLMISLVLEEDKFVAFVIRTIIGRI